MLAKFNVIIKYIIFYPIFFALRLIKPWKIIRFGRITSNSFGGMLIEPEVYLCHIDKYGEGKNFDIFYFNSVIANQFLAHKQRTLLKVWQVVSYLDGFNRTYLGWEDHVIHLKDFFHDPEGLLKEYPCHLTFTEEEDRSGKELMKNLGIDLNSPLVCFFNRDHEYGCNIFDQVITQPEVIDQSYRNTNIEDYIPAAEYLAEKGYTVIRMGKYNHQPIKGINPNIIDYVFSNKRSDFLDLYIFSQCIFAFGCATGTAIVATLFRKPVGYVNIAPFFVFSYNPSYNDFFLPNSYFLLKENRVAKFDEIIKFHLDNPNGLQYKSYAEERGIKYIKSKPDDIKKSVAEFITEIKADSNINSSFLTNEIVDKISSLNLKIKIGHAEISKFYLKNLINEEFFN